MANYRQPIHPGETLRDELIHIGMSASDLARILKVPPNRITEICAGKRAITADTALRLARYFGTSDRFWMNLQNIYELKIAAQKLGEDLYTIPVRNEL